ncbi:MAG: hotdog fold thioesterase [Chitinophagaceae bacterium]|nr:hotdog fold thioesterase [Chitinophagaceae bacterium]
MKDSKYFPASIALEIINRDNFIRWMKIRLIEAAEGYSKLQMDVRDEMLNGAGVVHGGVLFSLADSAFGIASNSRNEFSLAWDATITFIKAAKLWDILTAEAKELHDGKSLGLYVVTITNQRNEPVAHFKGTSFKKGNPIVGANKNPNASG